MTTVSRAWGRLTLPGKIFFTVVPLLLMVYVLLAKVGLSFSRLRHVREEIDAETGRTQVAP